MVATQRKQSRPRTRPVARKTVEYIAAVRYLDGRRELFYVRNADNLADARELVMLEVDDVSSLMIAERH
ncbi:hypothetical protein [Azonexus sp.]|uniref:hypothetical protein n=1 Tax=Azonexus sp. TaxID=1872668 RepID=UPI0035B4E807